MNIVPINRAEFSRMETYRHFTKELPCTLQMTVTVDVTELFHETTETGTRFYPALLYGIARLINSHEEFRMTALPDGTPGTYDVCHPCDTVFHPEGEYFTNRVTGFHPQFCDFYAAYLAKRRTEYGASSSEPALPQNLFYVSCIPWAGFTSFQLHVKGEFLSFAPIITIGKREEREGRVTLPIALQIHHAVCDGFHAARFFNELEAWAAPPVWE